MRILIPIVLSLLLCAEEASFPTITVTSTVEAGLDRRLFGGFLERPTFSDERGPEAICDDQGRLPAAVVERLRGLGTRVVRFPGGTGIEYDDWTDLIDRAPGRADSARPVTKGHKGGTYTNRFGLDAFLALRDELGFEALLVGNLRDALYGVKSIEAAAKHAAGMLAYCVAKPGEAAPGQADWGAIRAANGRREPVAVRLFAVGNEAQFYWPPKPADRERLGLADDAAVVARHVACLIAYADALHAVSPEVQLIVDGLHDPWNPANREANRLRRQVLFHPEVRRRYRYTTIHQYAPMSMSDQACRAGNRVPVAELSDDEVWYGLLGAPGLIDEHGVNTAFGLACDDLVAAGYRLAATEWNWNAWNTSAVFAGRPFSQAAPMALGAAGYLHGLIRQAAYTDLACQSMMLGDQWGITAVRATKGQEPYYLPQGQVLAFINALPGDRVLRLKTKDIPGVPQPIQFASWYPGSLRLALVDAVSLADESGVAVSVIHRGRNAALRVRVQLDAALPAVSSVTLRQLHGDSTADPFAGEVLRVDQRPLELATDGRSCLVDLPPASVVAVLFAR